MSEENSKILYLEAKVSVMTSMVQQLNSGVLGLQDQIMQIKKDHESKLDLLLKGVNQTNKTSRELASCYINLQRRMIGLQNKMGGTPDQLIEIEIKRANSSDPTVSAWCGQKNPDPNLNVTANEFGCTCGMGDKCSFVASPKVGDLIKKMKAGDFLPKKDPEVRSCPNCGNPDCESFKESLALDEKCGFQ